MEENKTKKLREELKAWMPCIWDQYVKYSNLHNKSGDEHFFSHQKFLCNIFDNITNYLHYVNNGEIDSTNINVDVSPEEISELLSAIFDEMRRVHNFCNINSKIFEEKLLASLYDSFSNYLEYLVKNNK